MWRYSKGNSLLQTLLFSATMPKWVADIAARFLQKDFVKVDMVGNEVQKVGRCSLTPSNPR